MKNLIIHNQDVAKVQQQIKQFTRDNPNTKLAIKRTRYEYHCNHSLNYKRHSNLVDITKLNDIVFIDKEKSCALIEPLVTMKSCVTKLLQKGWTLPVVPELPGITLGGAISGLGGESSSHKYGSVHDCCLAYEVLLGDGTLLTVNRENDYRDLFYALPGSYGSIALLVGVWINIIPAKPYVLLTAGRDTSIAGAIKSMQEKLGHVEFIEGIAYSNKLFATIHGDMTTNKSTKAPFYSMRYYWCPWFYRYVENAINKQEHAQFYMHLIDYYFRHNKSVFWLLRYKTSDSLLRRYLLGWLYDLTIVRQRSQKEPIDEKERKRIIQDVVMPFSNLAAMLSDIHRIVNVYPLWFMPIINRQEPHLFWSNAVANEKYFCDIGIYGKYATQNIDHVAANREIETKTKLYQGIKVLFARCYYTEAEFWSIYDKASYEKLRNKYGADKAFYNIYEKIST